MEVGQGRTCRFAPARFPLSLELPQPIVDRRDRVGRVTGLAQDLDQVKQGVAVEVG